MVWIMWRWAGRRAKWPPRVLNGESAESISFETIRDSALYLNTDVLSSLGLEIPAAMAERGYTDMAE